jgi:pyridoxal phosphate enzyme (YggS family)
MIIENLNRLHQDIATAERLYGRQPGSVNLLAVSKSKPAYAIAEAYRGGQRHFGENYCQEAIQKQQALAAYAITWHFIGPIQSNKTKAIAAHFDWVHSVDRLKIAQRLSEQRPPNLPALNICLQVNVSGETTKSGIALAELAILVDAVMVLPRLALRGVMAIPSPECDFEKQRSPYRRLFEAVKKLDKPELDTFSYGMSNDLLAAIAEGSTWLRIGTALFGARN